MTHERFWERGWVYERKLDGQRCLAVCDGDDVRLYSRIALGPGGDAKRPSRRGHTHHGKKTFTLRRDCPDAAVRAGWTPPRGDVVDVPGGTMTPAPTDLCPACQRPMLPVLDRQATGSSDGPLGADPQVHLICPACSNVDARGT